MTCNYKLDVDAGFEKLDIDGNGTITFDELIEAFKNGKWNWFSKSELRKWIEKW